MNLADYQTLTGITVPTSGQAKVTATIARTQSMLETLLGFTLTANQVTENLYNELGKTQRNCFCPSVDLENLLPADVVIGAYRLFKYTENDKYFHIDPFTKVHRVKLVFIRDGADATNGITIKTFDWDDIRINYGREGFAKYIEHCKDCICECSCRDCVQLAVDADWLWSSDLPNDLQYLWADMVTFYADDKKAEIKTESIDTHSYTRFDNKPPQLQPQNLAVLRRYAGPYGSAAVMPI
jgi:hypothetical protein